MSYEPTNWKKGDVVTSNKLNKIETGIVNASENIDAVSQGVQYLTPEMYNAVGDGITDDTVALQACINDAIEKGLPVKGYNTYKITAPINIAGRYLNIYLHIIKCVRPSCAIIMSGRYNYLYVDVVDASDSTDTVGFRLTTTSTMDATYNEIHFGYLVAHGNAIEYTNPYAVNWKQMYYNRLYVNQLISQTGHCIYLYDNNHQCAENSFWGKHVTNENGYVIYCEDWGNNITNRFYEFCIESSSKNGVYGNVTLINCRTVECMDRKTTNTPNEGNIFTFVDVLPRCHAYNTYIDYACIDVSQARTYEDCLDIIKEAYESGETKALSYDSGFPQDMFYELADCCRLWDYYAVENAELGNYCPNGKIIAYFNHKGFVPNYDWYNKITQSEYYTLTTDRIVPTIFDIDTNTTIYLDDSYCPVGINKFKVIQYENKKATIYDHNNVLVFDGQNLDEGTYIIECYMTNHSFEVETTSETLVYTGNINRGKYFGMNEGWYVTKQIRV